MFYDHVGFPHYPRAVTRIKINMDVRLEYIGTVVAVTSSYNINVYHHWNCKLDFHWQRTVLCKSFSDNHWQWLAVGFYRIQCSPVVNTKNKWPPRYISNTLSKYMKLFASTLERDREVLVSISCLFCRYGKYISFIYNVLVLYLSCNVEKSETTAKLVLSLIFY
jgi:hypothetical protein